MKYKIGDKVWYAQRKAVERTELCPDCFGQKALTVIKGDGERVSIECAGCASGYEPPKGFIKYHALEIDVSEIVIDRVEESSEAVDYGFRGHYRCPETNVFDTKEEAEKKAVELAEEHNKDELEKIHRKEKHNRTWAWNAHYHRQCIKSAEKEIARHTAKLNVAKEKAKDKSKGRETGEIFKP